MPYRGFFALNDEEFANTSRAIAHMGGDLPTLDFGYFGGDDGSYTVDSSRTDITVDPTYPWVFTPNLGTTIDPRWQLHPESTTQYLLQWHDHIPIESLLHPGCALLDDSQQEVSTGLANPPAGSRIFGPGLLVHDLDWGDPAFCGECRNIVTYDDAWEGLREFVGDVPYRVELAPWYQAGIPESGEFGGVWLMSVDGLDTVQSERAITQSTGNGATAGTNRDKSRTVTFDALLIGCSNAGVEHGLKWLSNVLRKTTLNDAVRLKYLTASPQGSAAQPLTLWREAHGCVLTQSPTVSKRYNSGPSRRQQGTVYRVGWTMETLSPYSYLPGVPVDVDWDQVTRQPINWLHHSDCAKPETCIDMPVMFSADCTPEEIQVVDTPPPVCGGCLPVGTIDKYMFRMPTMDYAYRGRQTVVSMAITNTGDTNLTFQGFFRTCGADTRCEDNQFPVQVTALPPNATLYLDGITRKFRMYYDELWRRPVGFVATPTGAPWRPAVLDRQACWEFIVQAPPEVTFDVSMQLYDREP